MKKRIIAAVLAILMLALPITPVFAGEKFDDTVADVDVLPFDLNCKSAVLMEAETGKVLYAKNENEALPPASVTKIMTLLLVMEEIDKGNLSLTDTVTASANASSMGGSQIFLKEGESMTVEDMLKSVVIASANDAACALAEHISGSEEGFVSRMNERAEELGMENSNFENTNGLDDTTVNHVTSALDIAIMSRELIKHKKVLEYSSRWMDSIRGGAFGLTNTNRLVRFYKGATGLKTGSTGKAGFCISATAERGELSLIAVIMGSPTRDIRNECAKQLLDYGFSNYSVYRSDKFEHEPLYVRGGSVSECKIVANDFSTVLSKGEEKKVTYEIKLPENLEAPVSKGERIGEIIYSLDGKQIGKCDIITDDCVRRISFSEVLLLMLQSFFFVKNT